MLKDMDDSVRLVLTGVVFILMLVFILFTSVTDKDYSFVDDYVDTISKKYDFIIDGQYTYARQNSMEVFVVNDTTYVKNGSKVYVLKEEGLVETPSIELIEDRYLYDTRLIAKLVKGCDYKELNVGILTCNVSAEKYNNKLSKMYGIGRLSNNDVVFSFHYSKTSVYEMIASYGDKAFKIEISEDKYNFEPIRELLK